MSGFKVGDRALVIRAILPENIGAVVTIESAPIPYRGSHPDVPTGSPVHLVSGPVVPATAGAPLCVSPPSWLKPLRDNGDEKIAWTEDLRRLCNPKVSA